MTVKIRGSCNSCGDVSLTVGDVTIRMLIGHENDEGGQQYRFRCSQCGVINVKETSLYVINLLIGAGVGKEMWDHPLEVLERPRDDAPVLNLNDAIDLHFDLEDEEAWIEKMKEPDN